MVIVKESSGTLGTTESLNGFGPPVGLNFSSRRDKRGMLWFVKTRKPIVTDGDSDCRPVRERRNYHRILGAWVSCALCA